MNDRLELRLERDAKNARLVVEYGAQGELRNIELARIGAKAILQRFPDEPFSFDLALTVVRALANDGVVFASLGSWDESEDET